MDHRSPPLAELTPKQALLQQIQAALSLYILDTPSLTDRKSYIPLQLSKQRPVVYRCAIAFKLSQLVNSPTIEVAQSISQLIAQQDCQQNLILQVVPPGWIDLELPQPSLAAWLQHWIETLPCLGSRGEKRAEGAEGDITNYQLPITNYQLPITNYQFPIQYAHARCCSLLKMAHEEKIIIIKSKNSDIKSSCLQVISPQPIPWLSEAKICLHHPSELNLLLESIGVLDALYCPDPTRKSLNWLKVALNLSQAFQTFYSQCRIWGEVKNQNLNLAQGRLGLIAIAQSVFRILLVEVLNSCAPLEL
ncbi:DALR anticodon-binding domain-containing protein [Chroococcidiopsis thermalis]|uniref:DALR anticodon binding domain protein n=1 Tax=Chroococcidiopsis thermalis (strain PCC 7203) TaxID=251229 RepID=K9U8Q0_CHRTP|nr:DALR anticodon-binding domain-containing protein [Chroococcidiopsis thermalis]AFY90791.1 DALR anticodon binding domain protein [Chroococcidiopsis thermalis PCC 7203]